MRMLSIPKDGTGGKRFYLLNQWLSYNPIGNKSNTVLKSFFNYEGDY